MKKNYLKKLLSVGIILVMVVGMMAGCGKTSGANSKTVNLTSVEENGAGTLKLIVNPEIDIKYDKQGKVTEVKAMNKDAEKILNEYKDYEGKDCKVVVAELVKAIGAAGYFIEDVDGNTRKVTIEIEKGSKVPSDTFINDLAEIIQTNIEKNSWRLPVIIDGKEYFGESDYNDEAYKAQTQTGKDSTKEDSKDSNKDSGKTNNNGGSKNGSTSGNKSGNTTGNQGSNKDGNTNYDSTTNYGNTNYDDGTTNYDSTTNYGNTNYDDGTTNYDSTTNYGNTNYDDGTTNYDSTTNYGNTNYDDGTTNYDSTTNYGNTNYDDGTTNYDDGSSNYDSSNYGDSDYGR